MQNCSESKKIFAETGVIKMKVLNQRDFLKKKHGAILFHRVLCIELPNLRGFFVVQEPSLTELSKFGLSGVLALA